MASSKNDLDMSLASAWLWLEKRSSIIALPYFSASRVLMSLGAWAFGFQHCVKRTEIFYYNPQHLTAYLMSRAVSEMDLLTFCVEFCQAIWDSMSLCIFFFPSFFKVIIIIFNLFLVSAIALWQNDKTDTKKKINKKKERKPNIGRKAHWSSSKGKMSY